MPENLRTGPASDRRPLPRGPVSEMSPEDQERMREYRREMNARWRKRKSSSGYLEREETEAQAVSERSWVKDAACRGLPTAMFYPSRGKTPAAALQVCRTCPVRVRCADYALRIHQGMMDYGVWGGTTGWDRRRFKTFWFRQGDRHGWTLEDVAEMLRSADSERGVPVVAEPLAGSAG